MQGDPNVPWTKSHFDCPPDEAEFACHVQATRLLNGLLRWNMIDTGDWGDFEHWETDEDEDSQLDDENDLSGAESDESRQKLLIRIRRRNLLVRSQLVICHLVTMSAWSGNLADCLSHLRTKQKSKVIHFRAVALSVMDLLLKAGVSMARDKVNNRDIDPSDDEIVLQQILNAKAAARRCLELFEYDLRIMHSWSIAETFMASKWLPSARTIPGGRPVTSCDVADFAIENRAHTPPVLWKKIAHDWNIAHGTRLSIKAIQEAVRRRRMQLSEDPTEPT